jgi:hypothetical protein
MALNTKMSKNCQQVVTIYSDDINPFTWNWIKKDAPESFVQTNLGVIKCSFIDNDELVIQQWRDSQHFLN